jgi:hypothetical protein
MSNKFVILSKHHRHKPSEYIFLSFRQVFQIYQDLFIISGITITVNIFMKESHLDDVMVSVLATEPKVCGVKPGRGVWFLGVIKIHSTPYFEGE